MTQRTGGLRARTRQKLAKKPRQRGKISLTRLTQELNVNDKVIIAQEPAIQHGMPHHRFKNKMGIVTGKRGRSYILKIKDGNKQKTVISLPIHLRPVK